MLENLAADFPLFGNYVYPEGSFIAKRHMVDLKNPLVYDLNEEDKNWEKIIKPDSYDTP